jgi:chaperonin GroEL
MIYERSKAKSIISDKNQIRDIVADTLDKMATIVGATMGPGGRPVLIERDGLSPLISKDGVTVAKSLGVDNAEANLIIEAAKEICLNTAKDAGDGTTTAIVLANAITKHGLDFLLSNPKYNPQRMVTELKYLYDNILVPFIRENARKVETDEELTNVARISANGDQEVAEAVVKAVLAAGEDGTVLVQESQDNSLRVEIMEGFIVTSGLKDLGSIGPAFINDRANQQAKMDNGLVFLYDGTINDLKVPSMIQQAVEGSDFYGKPIIIFAHGFADVVLDKCAKSTKAGYTIVPIKTPMGGYANSRTMFLFDMAAYTGATVYDPGTIDNGLVDEDDNIGFGSFLEAKINLYEGLVTSEISAEAIEQRVDELKVIAEMSNNDRDKMCIKAAIGKLTGGVSTIWVGGTSELEAREKTHRVEDSVEAVRSAISEGIVPGGTSMLLIMSNIISQHPEFKPSWVIMSQAFKAPFEILLSNCGEDVDSVWNSIKDEIIGKNTPPNIIFDASTHTLVDPMEAGIIEPAKVCRVSLGNALSVASLLITLGGMVVVPRNSSLETQLELSKQAFKDMFHGDGVGQQ